MKFNKKNFIFILAIITFLCFMIARNSSNSNLPDSKHQIYLYGELHGEKEIMDKELEIWSDYYKNYGFRHLFIEDSYAGAAFLNMWMKEDDDRILDFIYDNLKGTLAHNPYYKKHLKKIKENCPETIFNGTDVDHQYMTTGNAYLRYLRDNGKIDSYEYKICKENNNQGFKFYMENDDDYRENMMVKNFVREYEKLDDKRIMGIYGGYHLGLNQKDPNSNAPPMAIQLKEKYGDIIYTENLYDPNSLDSNRN